ncbi:hypothetical protein Syun_001479 [Stephania yunnanensis]|uniref:Uncharacterized protein n=1 Tax=Stephania yunnanensis TaxID=152371 RepID=A0AAP0LJH8_9MAGN
MERDIERGTLGVGRRSYVREEAVSSKWRGRSLFQCRWMDEEEDQGLRKAFLTSSSVSNLQYATNSVFVTLQCTMNNHRGTSYNLRETEKKEERQWRSQMEQRISAMIETHQKAIHNLTTMHDQRLADLAQSMERNMTYCETTTKSEEC